MRLVWKIAGDKVEEVKKIVHKNETLVRQSVSFRSAGALGLPGDATYLLIDGSEEAGRVAREELSSLAEEVKDSDAEEVLKRFDEAEESAAIGLGSVFG